MKFVNFILAVCSGAFGAFVFMTCWNWFPAEIFHIPNLTFVSAWGLSTIVFFFKFNMDTVKEGKTIERQMIESCARVLLYIFVLTEGFVIHLFM